MGSFTKVKAFVIKTLHWSQWFGATPFAWKEDQISVTKLSARIWKVGACLQIAFTIFVFGRLWWFLSAHDKNKIESVLVVQRCTAILGLAFFFLLFTYNICVRQQELSIWISHYMFLTKWIQGTRFALKLRMKVILIFEFSEYYGTSAEATIYDEKGWKLLETCISHANWCVAYSLPLGSTLYFVMNYKDFYLLTSVIPDTLLWEVWFVCFVGAALIQFWICCIWMSLSIFSLIHYSIPMLFMTFVCRETM